MKIQRRKVRSFAAYFVVRRKVEEGHYSTEAEVVVDALRLMQVRDEVAAVKRERLRDALDRGYEDVAAGRVIEFETEDQIDALFASLKRLALTEIARADLASSRPLLHADLGARLRPSTWTSFATR